MTSTLAMKRTDDEGGLIITVKFTFCRRSFVKEVAGKHTQHMKGGNWGCGVVWYTTWLGFAEGESGAAAAAKGRANKRRVNSAAADVGLVW